MKTHPDQPEPLWREVVGDTETWRRGRLFLIVFGILTLLSQALILGVMILIGPIELALRVGIGAAISWLLFYLIWIGIHWVRWLYAAYWGLCGFVLLIWAFRDSSGMETIFGSYCVVVAVFLGFVPSVHYFARRQRETKRVFEAVGVGVVILILIISLTTALVGLSAYKTQLGTGACLFGDQAFQSIFARHDTYYLLDKVSEGTLQREGRGRLTKFLQQTTIYAGDVHDIQPTRASVWFSYVFPVTLVPHAELITEAKALPGPVWLRMRAVQAAGEWRIDAIWWVNQGPTRPPPAKNS